MMPLTYERVQHNALTANFSTSPLRNIKTSNMFCPPLGHYHDLSIIDKNAL